ncbi:MAG: hypothetical protein PHI66_01860 [Candidatus Pacebacteria bacterium]|nr:hypothetical protein [Candidatus Paceibacterota bacterium]
MLVAIPVVSTMFYVFAMSSLDGARSRASDASFASSAAASVGSMLLCCEDGGMLQNTPGESVCSTGGYGNYPSSDYVKSIEVVDACGGQYGFDFKVIMTSPYITGKFSRAICTAEGCDFE